MQQLLPHSSPRPHAANRDCESHATALPNNGQCVCVAVISPTSATNACLKWDSHGRDALSLTDCQLSLSFLLPSFVFWKIRHHLTRSLVSRLPPSLDMIGLRTKPVNHFRHYPKRQSWGRSHHEMAEETTRQGMWPHKLGASKRLTCASCGSTFRAVGPGSVFCATCVLLSTCLAFNGPLNLIKTETWGLGLDEITVFWSLTSSELTGGSPSSFFPPSWYFLCLDFPWSFLS